MPERSRPFPYALLRRSGPFFLNAVPRGPIGNHAPWSSSHDSSPPIDRFIYNGPVPDSIASRPCSYYHLTALRNAAAIREVSIRPNEAGCIFLMKSWEIAGKIALNQVFVGEFAFFGIAGSLRVGPDRVAELNSKLHCIHRKPIPPDRLVWLGEFRAIPPPRVAEMLRSGGSGPITVEEQRQWLYTLPTIEQIKRDTRPD